MTERILLGRVRKAIPETQTYKSEGLSILGEEIYIEKHKWACGWYWGFGYIGNKNLHCHADVFIEQLLWSDVDDVFEESLFNNKNFWVFKDLLRQAYALKKTAEIYQYGGHCSSKKGVTDIILNKQMSRKLNDDLEKVLGMLWCFLLELDGYRNVLEVV